LYRNRKAPVKAFDGEVIFTCSDLLSLTIINSFFKKLKGKGGIYMFKYKENPNIYYIGRARDFYKRF